MVKYIVEMDDSVVESSTNPKSLRFVIKKKYIDIFIENRSNILLCHICGSKSFWDKKCYSLTYDIKNENIISNIRLKHYMDSETHRVSCCVKCFDIHARGLNPNSLKLISVKFGISEDESREVLHKRNKSPFYRINHENYEEYRKHQNVYYGMTEEEKSFLIQTQNKGRDRYRENFIDTYGYDKWVVEKRDSSSKDHFVRKYGDDWENKFYNKVEKTTTNFKPTNPDKNSALLWLKTSYGIHNEEDFMKEVNKRLSVFDDFYKSFYLEKSLLFKGKYTKFNTLFLFGMIAFDISDMYKKLGIEKNLVVNRIVYNGKKGRSIQFHGEGNFFRSIGEYRLYSLIKDHCEVIGSNKSYPDQIKVGLGKKFYDICILHKNKIHYIEKIGFGDDEKYMENIEYKVKKWGAIKVYDSGINSFVDDIKKNKDLNYEYK